MGIAGDAKYNSLRREIKPTMYMPLVNNSAHFELRTAADPLALVTLVHGIVSSVDDNLPLFDVRTQTEQIDQTLFLERLMSRLSSFFASLALVLAVHRALRFAVLRSGAAHARTRHSHSARRPAA